MTGDAPFTMSHGFEVLRPKTDKALPISCNEWDELRNQISQLSVEPWFFQTAGSLFLGASLATVISIWTDAIPPANQNAVIAAYAIAGVCFIGGVLSLVFAHLERGVFRTKAQTIDTQMRLIEERFER